MNEAVIWFVGVWCYRDRKTV